ncbi:potassium channel tetramerization domain-containing protein [Theileria equi strain WA]|uniref:Potassium channel tetramerization domain-containing protein n=1 Tax=Theileria equi strain WA TaxID=1537102 RepID=L0B0K8_THEEQ|nr:potassium channel tetramerization domain-containing protein [Theileria equi strain WA]AFZ81350.1 potassium channel tetramerization domain-containing protein [Theileria equi strain WA]|eukprot:XP_004831016.1 potassium channel tetramerization domain-containing protein [Theileria equi strain WA]
MQTPKKKRSDYDFYFRGVNNNFCPPTIDSSTYTCLSEPNIKDTIRYDDIKTKPFLNNQVVNINVGGIRYTTTLSTLSRDKNSYLYKYVVGVIKGIDFSNDDKCFEGYVNISTVNPGDFISIFVDRDGNIFQYILNYLRNGELFVPDDLFIYQSILSDAKFYNITDLVNKVQRKIDGLTDVPCDEVMVVYDKSNEPCPNQSQRTDFEPIDNVPISQLTNSEYSHPHSQNYFLTINETDNIEESCEFIQTTPLRSLGDVEFNTSADF